MAFKRDVRVSAPVRAILDELLKRQGESEISAQEAESLYGGHFPTTVDKLDTVELLQVALLEAYTMLNAKVVKQNRAQRRRNRH